MDRNLLSRLGLGPKEVALYQAVLKAKQISPTKLAKEAGIQRTTAYGMARGLVDKGLLVEDVTRRPRVFSPAQTEELLSSLETQRKLLDERESLLKELAGQVAQSIAEETHPIPRITFIEERKIDDFLRSRSHHWDENMLSLKETTLWGFQDATFVDHFNDWISWYWKQAPEPIDLKLLTNLSKTEKELEGHFERRHVKYWGEATDFISSTWIMGEYVLMINTRQKPFYLVEIHSKLLAHDQREVFRNLWELV